MKTALGVVLVIGKVQALFGIALYLMRSHV
jgi:hypothetical protein